ncbi:cilia- and flagella-associated protein 184 isoform X1 [Excalfactoria chinensis]|uniref:cilia- and flagella-associated protein 184 isoform X1 n=1 Tax=Excalfactoria chinensis TaxID=46218 RepID=UPI003B3A4DC7
MEAAEEPRAEEPRAEEPRAEEPRAEEPRAEEPRAEEPRAEEPRAEEPRAEEPRAEEPRAEEPRAEEPEGSGDKEVSDSEHEALSDGSEETEGSTEPPEPEGTAPGAGVEQSGAEEAASDGEDEEEQMEREALLAEYRELEAERQRLHQTESRLQLMLGELLRPQRSERRADEAGGQQLFAERLRELRELWLRREREAETWRQRVDARRRDREVSEARAGAAWAAFQARKKVVAVQTLGRRRGGREAALRTVGGIQAREQDRELAVREARLENIKVKLEVQNLESVLRAQGETQKGSHLAELSHMKKENQQLNEKLEGLNSELLKLKRKVADAERVLSHVREKLQLVEAENQGRKAELRDIMSALLQKRDALTKIKKARDKLRAHSLKLQQQRGLLGEETLLRDFEERVNTVELLHQRLEALKHHHAALSLKEREIQKKISKANSFLP